MKRRTFLTITVTTPLVLVACGSDDDGAGQDPDSLPPATEPPPTDSTPPDTPPETPPETPPVTSPETPPETDAPVDPFAVDGDVVISHTVGGGFTTPEIAFQNTPALLVTADGRAITPAPTLAVYPGPLVPPLETRSITADGVRAIIAAADEAGLLQPVVYPDKPGLADAPTTRLVIATPEATYVHESYGLGIATGDPADPLGSAVPDGDVEQRLIDFLTRLGDLETLAGAAELGAAEPYVPDAYEFTAILLDPDLSGYDPAPTVVDWPADVELAGLRDPGACARLGRDEVGELFENATQLTFFREGDATYQVLVRPASPGSDGC